jgi:predicted RND superfamily exporter protein
MKEEKKENDSFWYKVASFIVNKRKAILILFVFAVIYCVLCFNRVKVNQDITKYLPKTSETRIGLDTMNDEFVTYGSAKVMVTSVTYDQAKELADSFLKVKNVKSVTFDNDTDHYKGTYALIDVTVDGEAEDKASIKAIDDIKELLSNHDYYIETTIGEEERNSESLNNDIRIILILSVIIIVLVLLISTHAFAQIPVLLLTFGMAAILNKGTNYWMGTISSVTDSIAVVLQLALAIDYAIILCDRYMEEHEKLPAVEACKVALSKAIPEISSSCLTTVSGMLAMMFMQFKLGYDMGFVLVKAILFSLVAVFFFMPGILLIFSNLIDKTRHKCYVPKISFVGKFASLTKWIIPPIFAVVLVAGFIISNNCQYLYDTKSVESAKKSESRIATEKIEENFGSSNQLVVMVPVGDYESEAKYIRKLEKLLKS